jgi:hypothetical protein
VGKKNAVLEGKGTADAVEEQKEEAAVATEEAIAGKTASSVEVKKDKGPVEDIREYTDREFREAYPEICAGLMTKAKDGDIPQIKMLLEIIAGKYDDPEKAEQQSGKSLSELLMDELKRRQDEREAAADAAKAEEQIAKDAGSNDAGSNDAGNGDAGNGGAKSGGEAEHA